MKLFAIFGTLVALGSAGLLFQEQIADLATRGRCPGRDRPAAAGERPVDDQRLAEQSHERGDVLFRGGLATDQRDGGRPVRLIAAALGVADDVFRDAFSGVRPSFPGPPSGTRARANKRVLMEALAPYGVSNERLDEVSDYYRYRPQAGERWPHQPATATAVIEDGRVVGLTLQSGGHGYLTAPQVVIVGHEPVRVEVELGFGSDLLTNGQIVSLQLAGPPSP